MYRCEHGEFEDGCSKPCAVCGHVCESHPLDFCIECDGDCAPLDPGDRAQAARTSELAGMTRSDSPR